MAKANPFRFSTKYQDDETDLLYYGYRYYSASTGTWLSRDPIDEVAFRNRYAQSLSPIERGALYRRRPSSNESPFVDNNPVNIVDPLGLTRWCGYCEIYAAGVAVGLQFLECDLTTACGACKYEDIRIKAWFVEVSASPTPVNYIRFRTCFETPDSSDYTAFNGAARLTSITVAVGSGKTGGKIVLGGAESEGVVTATGFDWSAGFGAGRSRITSHSPCR
jgi:RHS repeat-associated protein